MQTTNMVFHKDQLLVLFCLFIIYICDLFIINKDVNFSSYADDTTALITGMSFEKIIPELEISYQTSHNGL